MVQHSALLHVEFGAPFHGSRSRMIYWGVDPEHAPRFLLRLVRAYQMEHEIFDSYRSGRRGRKGGLKSSSHNLIYGSGSNLISV